MIAKKNTRKNIICPLVITAFILLIPLVAMQFTDEVDWSPADFIIMGALVFGTGLAIEFVASKLTNATQKAIVIVTILAVFLLIWAELAVGIFNTPFAGS